MGAKTMSSDALERGWGPGWPDCQVGKIKTLTRKDGLRIALREELIPLAAHLLDETERRGYDVLPGQTWGFACRPIRGYQVASNHSWGLAIDINAPTNGMAYGTPGWAALHKAGRTDMPEWLPSLWGSCMFRWGGDYLKRQDPMHLEFMGTTRDAMRITNDVLGHTAPYQRTMLPLKPTKPVTKNATVGKVQLMLNGWVLKHGIKAPLLKVDDVYGPTTQMYVHAFKEWVIAVQRAYNAFHPDRPMAVWPNSDTAVGPVTFGGLQYWSVH